jgi:hypothetical protein
MQTYKVKTMGVSPCGLAIYIQKDLKAKNNYGNSNISPCKNIPNIQKIL